jgi:hypothetical protein
LKQKAVGQGEQKEAAELRHELIVDGAFHVTKTQLLSEVEMLQQRASAKVYDILTKTNA